MTIRRYRIRPLAEADLDRHARNIARDNLEAALSLYDRAEETFEMLGEMPHMGAIHHTNKFELKGTRYVPIIGFSHYLVFYQPIDDGVDIIRVLYVRMDRDGWL